MPVRKRSDGWYWGSKGPFGSEAKAREVERAAYASGYKGKKKTQRRGGKKKNRLVWMPPQ